MRVPALIFALLGGCAHIPVPPGCVAACDQIVGRLTEIVRIGHDEYLCESPRISKIERGPSTVWITCVPVESR